jgi:cell division protein FtsI/penicillin-binding protein 2
MRQRIQVFFLALLALTGLITLRLAYWQLIRGRELASAAESQYESKRVVTPTRGEIVTADGFPLVVNKPVYALGAYLPAVTDRPQAIVDQVLPRLTFTIEDPAIATDPARAKAFLETAQNEAKASMLTKLSSQSGYVVLANNLSVPVKQSLESLGIPGLSFDESFVRDYPEASLSAHVVGFVGRDEVGAPLGYFGLEGFYNRELEGKNEIEKQDKDALGNPLLLGDFRRLEGRDGRDLKLHIERSAAYIVESELKRGIERYGAVSGDVVVMDPETGGIIAMASYPTYNPSQFYRFDTSLYKNPIVANTYEPGSTFKVLIMAAAFNEGVVSESDHCDICHGPYQIDKYAIKTWDGKYRDQATPEDIIVHSDNVGMVWTAERLGNERLLAYIKNYGFGEKTGIDVQEEVAARLRERWGDIDYATASFGQGIAVTSIQMVRAVAAIANGGRLMEPHVVASVLDHGASLDISPKVVRTVLSQEATKKITKLMVAAVDKGEAKWAKPKGYQIAGKTGTAQIAVSGHYDAQKTIASFVGFAPADHPRFVMLVKLQEPQSSQWGSETAAPLWFAIAKKLLLHYNIPPSASE